MPASSRFRRSKLPVAAASRARLSRGRDPSGGHFFDLLLCPGSLPLPVLLLVAGCAGGAREEGPTPPAAAAAATPRLLAAYDTLPDEPWVRHPDSPALECETHGYACSWGEVDPEEVDRAFAALLEAQRMLEARTPMAEIADWLRGRPGVVQVEEGDGIVRFHVEGTPPLFLMEQRALPAVRLREGSGRRGGQQGAGEEADGVAAPTGLAWFADRSTGGAPVTFPLSLLGSSPLPPSRVELPPRLLPPRSAVSPRPQPAPGDPVVGDNSDHTRKPFKRALILSLFDWEFHHAETNQTRTSLLWARSYGCEGCVELRTTTYNGGCSLDTAPGECYIDVQTSWRDFQGWDRYDIVHVGTHGGHVCTGTRCLTHVLTGNRFVWMNGDPMDAYRRAAPGGLVRAFRPAFPPGVTYAAAGRPSACDPLATDTRLWRSMCADGMVHEIVTDDFFRWRYPRGLDDKILVFSACAVFNSSHFIPHLVRGGNSTAVGWMDVVDSQEATDASLEFYTRLVGSPREDYRTGGQRAGDAWAFAVGEVWPAGSWYRRAAGEVEEEWTRAAISLPDFKRGREMPFLVDPRTDREVEDGERLEVRGISGDGRPDSIVVRVDVGGIGDQEDPADYPIRFRVDGEDLPGSYLASQRLDQALHRFEGVVPLRGDTRPGQRVDLDVRVEAPGGGYSRWLYTDLLLLGACSFAGALTEVRVPEPRERYLAAVGPYEGRAIFEDGGRVVLTIENQGRPGRDHGTPEVTEFTLTVNPREAVTAPTPGPAPLASAALQLSRPNPFHNPARTNRSTETLFTSFDYDPRQDDRRGPAGVVEVEWLGTGYMVGRVRIDLSRRDAALRFEGVFNAGRASACGG